MHVPRCVQRSSPKEAYTYEARLHESVLRLERPLRSTCLEPKKQKGVGPTSFSCVVTPTTALDPPMRFTRSPLPGFRHPEINYLLAVVPFNFDDTVPFTFLCCHAPSLIPCSGRGSNEQTHSGREVGTSGTRRRCSTVEINTHRCDYIKFL